MKRTQITGIVNAYAGLSESWLPMTSHRRPKSCGCVKRVFKRKDLTGKKFGYWVVLGFAEKRNRYSLWNCRCVCGKEKAALASTLITGRSKNCGCERNPPGYSKSPTYRSWMAMRQRCNNPKSDNYARYGALEITVCRSWNKSFKAFLKDMGIRPEGTTLDRIENSKGYFPGNVRWATPAQQGHNRRDNKLNMDLARASRKAYEAGETAQALAQLHGVRESMIHGITGGHYWKEVETLA